MDLRRYLDQMGCQYEWSARPATMPSGAGGAASPEGRAIKPVVVKLDGELVLCAVPVSSSIDLHRLRSELGVEEARFAEQSDLDGISPECRPDEAPPIGWLFGLPTLMEESLMDDHIITFRTGEREAVTMTLMDYYRLAKPVLGTFSRPA